MTHQEFTKYIHVRDNYVAYNILSNCVNKLEDAGALYSFGTSPENRFEYNIVRDSHDKSIYLDNYTGETVVLGNIFWGESGTISKPDGGPSVWKDCRFGGVYRPEGYSKLFFKINNKVDQQGGWPAPIDLQLPAVNIELENGRLFDDKRKVEITSYIDNAEIRYTTDGQKPSQVSKLYTAPFFISRSMTVSAAVFKDGRMVGEVDTIPFVKICPPIKPDKFLSEIGYELEEANDKLLQYNSTISRAMGTPFQNSIAMYRGDKIVCNLKPEYKRFVALLAMDDVSDARGGSVFKVQVDDEVVYETPRMTRESEPIQIDIPIKPGSQTLRLIGSDPGFPYWIFWDLVNAGFIQ